MTFGVTHYLELHNAISFFIIDVVSYQVNFLMFYNVQTIIWHLLVNYKIYIK